MRRSLPEVAATATAAVAPAVPAASAEPAADGLIITDDEFEALLDQLHGKGTFAPKLAGSRGHGHGRRRACRACRQRRARR
ncbi:hypothetical protein AZH11_28210 [Pseudomonas simiae]|nr:hypothetical protein AZH11_28210 [Pseudomonas simiae]